METTEGQDSTQPDKFQFITPIAEQADGGVLVPWDGGILTIPAEHVRLLRAGIIRLDEYVRMSEHKLAVLQLVH